MKRNVSIYLKDMLENMELAEEFIRDMSYDVFLGDEKTQYAVIRCVEVIGEAAKNVPSPVKDKHPEVPWRDIAGMRDKAIHFYFGMDPKRVWLVVKEDIPVVRPLIKKILMEKT